MTQLSLVEHALCPLDPQVSMQPHLMHGAEYFFTDRQGSRRKATARVICPSGLSAHDEFYLWGLLALNFSQAEPAVELLATPHYCLRQLGVIDERLRRGGKNYDLFRSSTERLAAVTYQSNNFWDPVRGEHCAVSFGFFSYRLPLDHDSSRAWRFYFDPLFFEITKAAGSALAFDLPTYHSLDSASRRLYLFLKQILHRRATVSFDVRHIAVNVLGFSATQEPWRLRAKLAACLATLIDHQLLAAPQQGSVTDLFRKQRKGHFTVAFHRGPQFDRVSATQPSLTDSPQYDLLQTIGFDRPSILRILRSYKQKHIAEWIDITLAARERYGEKFFKRNPQAYFLDNLRHAATDGRTPPDWWHELRRKEERDRYRTSNDDHDPDASLDRYLETEAREAFDRITDRIFTNLRAAGTQEVEARHKARYIARTNLAAQFYREHPECRPAEAPVSPAEPFDADE